MMFRRCSSVYYFTSEELNFVIREFLTVYSLLKVPKNGLQKQIVNVIGNYQTKKFSCCSEVLASLNILFFKIKSLFGIFSKFLAKRSHLCCNKQTIPQYFMETYCSLKEPGELEGVRLKIDRA